MLTQLGIGEALVTALNEKGIPTMLTATMMCSPASRMDVLSETEINELVKASQLTRIYNQVLDRESAFEMLNRRMQDTNEADEKENDSKTDKKRTTKEEPGTFEKMLKSPVVRAVGVSVAGLLTRSLLGSLGLKSRSRTTKR